MSDTDAIKRLHLVVSGDVQGVGFRAFTSYHAEQIGLTGWVRNLSSGQVEIMAEGSLQDLLMFFVLVNAGPSHATVTQVTQEWLPASGEFPRFQIIASAF